MRLRRKPDVPDTASQVEEDPVVRQYRFLLRTAPADAVEAAHVEVLPQLASADREGVLVGIQRGLGSGGRLHADDHERLAHLLVNGERREPSAFLRACPPAASISSARTFTRLTMPTRTHSSNWCSIRTIAFWMKRPG